MLTPKWVTSGFGIIRGWPGDPEAPPGDPSRSRTFAEGSTATGVFGARNRGGTDTAADLVGGDPLASPGPHTDEGGGNGTGGEDETCDAEEAAVGSAALGVKRAKGAVTRAAARKRSAASRRRARQGRSQAQGQ